MKRLNMKRIGVISVVLVVALSIVLFVFKMSVATKDSSALRDQKVKGISFENATIEKKKGENIFTVNLFNEGTTKMEIESLTFVFKLDKKDVKVKLEDVESLEVNEGRQISVTVKDDITDCNDIEYKIVNK